MILIGGFGHALMLTGAEIKHCHHVPCTDHQVQRSRSSTCQSAISPIRFSACKLFLLIDLFFFLVLRNFIR
jgi:hypothetical protein